MLLAIAGEKVRHYLSTVMPLLVASVALAMPEVAGADPPLSEFKLEWQDGHVTSLRRRDDAFDTPYLRAESRLGDVVLRYRNAGGPWNEASTRDAEPVFHKADGDTRSVGYRFPATGDPAIEVRIETEAAHDTLTLRATVKSLSARPIEVGDLAIPLPMNTRFRKGTSTSSVLKHSFVSGHGSFFYWMRSNSVGPYLMMTPVGDTSLEYWSAEGRAARGYEYWVYAHSRAAGEESAGKGGCWRQPHTSCLLNPSGSDHDSQDYTLQFAWADSHNDVRENLYSGGSVDVVVAPGMTVPSDLTTQFAVRSQHEIHRVEAEHPKQTEIKRLPSSGDYERFQVRFDKLGENRLTVHYGDNRHVHLEFFSTAPLETLIEKRAKFIASCQHLDPEKWYHGLISEWNMESSTLLGPDNYDKIRGWRIYEVTCDDPGLSKPAFLAAKNSLEPSQSEVTALDDYLEHFVWGGLQRTTEESYSYGIYGIPDWKQNRGSDDPGEKGRLHLWRPYDYPHIVLVYYHMHLIARDHPEVATRLSADEYLQRAYGTARAMFTVPWSIVEWSGYPTGYYNELVLVDLIEALEAAGKSSEASLIRQSWEQKVRYFVGGKADWFQSEYAFDSTGFESTHALAKYAIEKAAEGEDPELVGYTAAQAKGFMEAQLEANLFCRGVIEPAYYYLGSDYRGGGGDRYTLSYMSQMGGWAVLDYGLHYSEEPVEYLRLGYASILSAWALMNTGTEQSDYGYWYPGKRNDGAAGGGFEPARSGTTWLGQPHSRGAWYYACETDLGYCAALRAAATILTDDPVFGRLCYGGVCAAGPGGTLHVTPRDGVRRRFSSLIEGRAVHLALRQDRFAKDQPIRVDPERPGVRFCIESGRPGPHRVQLEIAGDAAEQQWSLEGPDGPIRTVLVPSGTAGGVCLEFIAVDGLWVSLRPRG